MRGLLKASLLLAPVVASALVVPDVQIEDFEDDRVIADHSFALIGLEIPPRSPDGRSREALAFRLDVLPSEEACGLGNVKVDGQVLPQSVKGDSSTGKGSVTTDRKNIIGASWSFHCVKVNGQPDSQFMKFVVEVIDGKAVRDVGFSALFRQTGSTEIINIETDLSLPEQLAANPNSEYLQSVDDEESESSHFDIEQEMDDLDWMRAQLKELEYLIWTKERAIAEHAHANFEVDIKDCDSLRCLANAVVDKARKAAHEVMNGRHGEHHGQHHEVADEGFGHFPKPPFKKPHWWPGNPKHGKHGNHTCGPPKHGNHTHGNHTHPPHWKRPHHRPLPICRYPPPGKGGRHHPPPHHPHPPPHHGERPPPPPHHGERPPPPPHHGGPPSDHDEFPQHPRPNPHRDFPEGDDFPPPPPGQSRPPHGRPEHEHGGHEHGQEPHDSMPPQEGHRGPPGHERPHDRPEFDHPPPPDHEAELPFHISGNGFDHVPPPPPAGPPPFEGRGPHNGMHPAFHVLKFVIMGILISLLGTALLRRACSPSARASREERHRRRAYRRAARKHTLMRFLGFSSPSNDNDDYEEKRQAILASDAEDGMSTTMTEEITQLRNAAEVVDGMVVATSHSQAQPMSIPAVEERPAPMTPSFDFGSHIGDGEQLPAYEDREESEMGSVVTDGFRYTPGSTEYSPAHSPAGSVSDILGPDTKS